MLETGAHYPLRLELLPLGWQVGYVGDFAKEIEPGFASGEHNQTGRGVPHLRPMNVDRDGKIDLAVVKYVAAEKDHRRLKSGDVLFNNTNSPELVGKTAVVNQTGDLAFSNHMTRIRFGEDVLPKFGSLQLHFLWMRGYFRYNCVKHVNQASISSKTLARAVPFIWAPVEDQERIVAEIEKQFSRLDEAVANLKRVKANLKRYKAAVLKAAVEGRLVPTEAELARREGRSWETGAQLFQRVLETRRSKWTGKAKYAEPKTADTSRLPQLPDGWAWVPFGHLGSDPCNTVQTGPFGAQLHNSEFATHGVPVIAVGNLTGTGFSADGLYFITEAKAKQLARYDVWAGDLLFARSGATLGKVCVAPSQVKNWRMTGHILRARLNEQFIKPAIAVYSLAALPAVRRQVFGNVRGVTRPGFNTTLLESILIPVPPLAEQHRIAAEADRRLSFVYEVETEVDANLRRAESLRQATLTRLFNPLVKL